MQIFKFVAVNYKAEQCSALLYVKYYNFKGEFQNG